MEPPVGAGLPHPTPPRCGTLIERRARRRERMDTSELLKQLRIDRDGGRPRRSRRRLVLLAAAAVAALGVLLWLVLGWGAPTVRTAVARAASAPGAGSVLDASGY